MNDRSLQYFMSRRDHLYALVAPPSGSKDVARYLRIIGRSLGYKTDAALSQFFGVPPTSIANWKRRGQIPADAEMHLKSALVEKVAAYTVVFPDVGLSARSAVLHLLQRTKMDPLSASADPFQMTSLALPALLNLAEMIVELASAKGQKMDPVETSEMLQVAMIEFRMAFMDRVLRS